jgi:hypothetical protein
MVLRCIGPRWHHATQPRPALRLTIQVYLHNHMPPGRHADRDHSCLTGKQQAREGCAALIASQKRHEGGISSSTSGCTESPPKDIHTRLTSYQARPCQWQEEGGFDAGWRTQRCRTLKADSKRTRTQIIDCLLQPQNSTASSLSF